MMKGIFRGIICPLLALSAVALTGCERLPDVSGTPVVFSAGTSNGTSQGKPKSRVSYGDISGETGSKSQAIDWVVGDKITVYCAQCEGAKIADYIVTELGPDEDHTTNDYARIGNVGASGLQWGTGEHTFYAVHPGTTTTGGTVIGKDITGSIPADQDYVGTVTGTDAKVASPNMNYLYMAAKNTIAAKEAGQPVFLEFKPLTTVLEFTITNQFDETNSAMEVSSISLISAGHALSGGFKVDMDETGRYGRGKTTLGAGTVAADCNKVTINFASPVEVAYGKTLTFTFFLNPGNTTEVNDLTFEISGTNAETSEKFTRRAKLEYKTHTGVTFPTHQKTIIKGLMVPEGIGWTVIFDPTVQSWDTDNSSIDPMPETGDTPTVVSWDTDIDEELALKPELVKWIDFDLPSGKLWADRNVGANATYDVGDYYAWGETEIWYTSIDGNTVTMKPEYSQFNWTEYAAKSNMKSVISNLTGTYASYDVARLLYGSDCHIPSDNEYKELIDNCYWRYVSSYDGQSVEGYMIFKAKNDADKGKYTLKNPVYVPVATYSESDTHIFLPFSGFITGKTVRSGNIDNGDAGKTAGYYLTSTTGQVALTDSHAGHAGFERVAVGVSKPTLATVPRHAGMPVRAVKQKPKAVEYVEIAGLKWATTNIGANTPKECGWYFFWAGTTGYVYDGSKWVKASDSTAELSGGFSLTNTPYHTGVSDSTDWKKYIPTNRSGFWSGEGSPDDKLVLDPEDDAARANWGGSWRMPTQADFQTLYEACGGTGSTAGLPALPSANPGKGIYWVSKEQIYIPDYTGVAGVLFCDGANKLFFVAAGYGLNAAFNGAGTEGRYWSKTVFPNPPSYGYRLGFKKNDNVSPENANLRNQGLTVRPVAE